MAASTSQRALSPGPTSGSTGRRGTGAVCRTAPTARRARRTAGVRPTYGRGEVGAVICRGTRHGEAALGRRATGGAAAAHREEQPEPLGGVPVPAGRHHPAPRGGRVVGAVPVQGGRNPEAGHDVLPGDPGREAAGGHPGRQGLPGGDEAAGRAAPADPQLRVGPGGAQRRLALRHLLRGRPDLRRGPVQARQRADGGARARRVPGHRARCPRAAASRRDRRTADAADGDRRTTRRPAADRRALDRRAGSAPRR